MLVLASGSTIRAEMLRNVGVSLLVDPAVIDEATIRNAMLNENRSARDIAEALAATKALDVAKKHPAELVMGADQVLVCDGILFEKPSSLVIAIDQLRLLRGKQHELLSAVAAVENGIVIWRSVGLVRLTMREFSDAFISEYVKTQGEDLLTTVGGYKLEGAGAQLFSYVEGDYFSVLGLPLLDVLAFLRTKNIGVT